MVKVSCTILLLFFTIILVNGQESKIASHTLLLTNELLKKEIMNYNSEVKIPSVEEKVPYLTINRLGEDTTEYIIDYMCTSMALVYNPVAFFFDLNGKYVPVVLSGMMFKDCFFFEFKEEIVIEYMKTYFPREYKYYKENGDIPPPVTARDVIWILTFKGKKFIKKEIIEN